MERAEEECRILVTIEKDFLQIAVQRRPPIEKAGVILFRVHPATPENLEPLVHAFLNARRPWAGHLSIITRTGIQILATAG